MLSGTDLIPLQKSSMMFVERCEKTDLLQAKGELSSDVSQTFSVVSWWWPCYPPRHPSSALQTHIHPLVRNSSPCLAPRESGADEQDTAGCHGGHLMALLSPRAVEFLLLGQVGSSVVVRMSYCGWTGSKRVPSPVFNLCALSVCI